MRATPVRNVKSGLTAHHIVANVMRVTSAWNCATNAESVQIVQVPKSVRVVAMRKAVICVPTVQRKKVHTVRIVKPVTLSQRAGAQNVEPVKAAQISVTAAR